MVAGLGGRATGATSGPSCLGLDANLAGRISRGNIFELRAKECNFTHNLQSGGCGLLACLLESRLHRSDLLNGGHDESFAVRRAGKESPLAFYG